MSVVEDVEKLVWEVERSHLCIKKLKEHSDKNLKEKLWYEFGESVVTNWSELPAEQKSEKVMLILLLLLLRIMLMMLIHCEEAYTL
jgi:hypothetical protein